MARRSPPPALAALVVIAFALVAVFARRDEARDATAPLEREPASTAQAPEPGALAPDRVEAPDRAEVEAAREGVIEAVVPTAAGLRFVGALCDPRREPLRVPHLVAELVDAAGVTHRIEARDAEELTCAGFAPGACVLRVEAAGFTHREQRLVLDNHEGTGTARERVYLWPRELLPVIVRLPDGRPFSALADDRDWHPKRLFAGAFRVLASTDYAAGADRLTLPSEGLVTFHRPGGYQSYEVTEGVIGALELHERPPLWVGLWVHGSFERAVVLGASDREVVFELDGAALDAHLASVRLRVVDRDTQRPVEGAFVTLKADSSAYRRADLSDAATDAAGEVHLERVIPGDYELTIVRGGNQVQRRLGLGRGPRDLGDFALGSGPAVRVRVVDADGEPQRAFLEIAPYERGCYAHVVYPPNLHRATDDGGVYDLPVPDRRSIVRARPILPSRSVYTFTHPEVGTANVLLDPANVPAELVLVVAPPLQVRLEPREPWRAGEHVEVYDALRVIVDARTLSVGEEVDLDLVPGAYVVRRFDAQRTAFHDEPITLEPTTRAVHVP